MQITQAALLAMHASERTGDMHRLGHVAVGWSSQLTAAVLLLVLSPVFALIALLIAGRDGSPVFYGHLRVSRHGELFRCLKFRTMYRDSERMLTELLASSPAAASEWARDQKLTDDPRVTPIGAFLRRTSLDELPQLVNVLRGDMGLVGPRPVTVQELSRYGTGRWDYLSVRPGITGLWQVSGRSDTTYEQRVALDREYVRSRTMWLDVAILYKTVRVVLRGSGAR